MLLPEERVPMEIQSIVLGQLVQQEEFQTSTSQKTKAVGPKQALGICVPNMYPMTILYKQSGS